jgi:hypothetical protein
MTHGGLEGKGPRRRDLTDRDRTFEFVGRTVAGLGWLEFQSKSELLGGSERVFYLTGHPLRPGTLKGEATD